MVGEFDKYDKLSGGIVDDKTIPKPGIDQDCILMFFAWNEQIEYLRSQLASTRLCHTTPVNVTGIEYDHYTSFARCNIYSS